MSHRPRIALLTVMLLTLVAASVPGCGGDNGTNPGGGGGTKELDSGVIANGGTYMHTFSTAGTYNYCCTIHGCAAMNAKVTVAGGNPATDAVTITNNAFSKDAAVSVGGTVTWTNNGSNHTVTSN
jgi:plastocyanin